MTESYELASCPVCAGDTHEVVADGDAVRSEIEALWEHHTEGTVTLDSAALIDRVAFTHGPPLRIVRCVGCGLIFRNPRERRVRELYEGEIVDGAALAALRAAQVGAFREPVARLTALNGGPGRVLEVGSYAGAFLAAACEAGWQARGVDVSAAAVAFQRDGGLDVAHGSIEDVPAQERFDAIAFWNCFDQLPDPAAAAHAAHARLRPRGLLAVRVPNGELYLALRSHLHGPLAGAARALLARQNLLGFPYRHGFTRDSLRHVLVRTGFELVEEHRASVLPAAGPAGGLGSERLLLAAERALRPLVGPPWLEVYARSRRGPRPA